MKSCNPFLALFLFLYSIKNIENLFFLSSEGVERFQWHGVGQKDQQKCFSGLGATWFKVFRPLRQKCFQKLQRINRKCVWLRSFFVLHVLNQVDLFLTNVPFLYALKTSENTDISRGYRSGTMVENVLINQCFASFQRAALEARVAAIERIKSRLAAREKNLTITGCCFVQFYLCHHFFTRCLFLLQFGYEGHIS